MASRPPRYESQFEDKYTPDNHNTDSYPGANTDDYDYIEPDAFPEPPPHTFEDDGVVSPRRRSPSRRRRSNRASTQPPKTSTLSPPPKARRAASPPARSSKYAESPPRRSKRTVSPPRNADATGALRQSRHAKLIQRPAVQNMRTYGKKGLNTLGEVVGAYVAAQIPPDERGRPTGRDDPYGSRYAEPDPYLDPADRPSRHRRRYSISPSPPPPPRASARHSARRRPPLNGRQKSYSVSPAPLSRDLDRGEGRGRSRRHSKKPSSRYSSPSSSSSVSPNPRRRRHRSHSHRRDGGSTVSGATSQSRSRNTMAATKEHMASPHPEIARRWQLAARAALEAGGVTAYRLRKEPGSWAGPKGAKVATAALGAAAIDAFIDKDPRRDKVGGMKGMAESVIGGMIASKVMGFKSATTRKGTYRYK